MKSGLNCRGETIPFGGGCGRSGGGANRRGSVLGSTVLIVFGFPDPRVAELSSSLSGSHTIVPSRFEHVLADSNALVVT